MLRCALGMGLSARLLDIFKEIGTRIHNQDVILVLKALFICVQAAVERIEFRIDAKGPSGDGGDACIAFAPSILRFSVRLGQQDIALAIGLGADNLGLLGTFGT